MIELGQKVRDTVSGFEGIATSRLEFLNGCVQYGLQGPVDKDGKKPDAEWFDAQQIEVVGEGILLGKKVTATGGPVMNAPTRYRG